MIIKQTKQYTFFKYKYANKSAVAPESAYLGLWVVGETAQHVQLDEGATDEVIISILEQNVKEYLNG